MSDRFVSTRWSVVLQAGRASGARRDEALEQLCQAYWYPLFEYVRRRGFEVEEARDLTQGFFARLLEKGVVADADPARGRFRSFLLTALQHYLANEKDRAEALKRGGGQRIVPLEVDGDDRRRSLEPLDHDTPEKRFVRSWALTLVDRAMERLAEEYAGRGRHATFERLQEYLGGASGGYSEAAADLGVTVGAVKVTVHRMRGRLREILRSEIAETVEDPDTVDEELRELFAALQG